jgi:hypothetical protein
MDDDTRIALHRLLVLAMDDAPGSGAAASFLLAWWNAPEFGGFDLVDLDRLEPQNALDASCVFAFIAQRPNDPLAVFDPEDMAAVIKRWRPRL